MTDSGQNEDVAVSGWRLKYYQRIRPINQTLEGASLQSFAQLWTDLCFSVDAW